MNGEDRISGTTPQMEDRSRREQINKSGSYERDVRLQKRKIGSLVQSEALDMEERAVKGRLAASEQHHRRRAVSYTENYRKINTEEERQKKQGASAELHKKAVQNIAAVPEQKVRQEEEASVKRGSGNGKSSTGWKERMQERKKKRMKHFFIAMGSVIGVIYIAVAVYFGLHFYEGTIIYGVDCSQKKVDQVKAEVADRLDEYVLTIECREGNRETISAQQIALEFVDNSSIDQMLKAQHCYIWPIMMLLERSPMTSVAFSYDERMAEQVINSMGCMDPLWSVAPQDAYIGTTDTGFEVVPEVMGTTLDPQKTKTAIFEALDMGVNTVSLEEKDCYVNPNLYSDDKELNSDAQAMSKLARAYITYDFGPQQEVVNAPVIRDWIVELADGSFVIDDMKVTEYVENLAAKYDTFGLPVQFYTTLGTTETLSGGDYGWCIDQNATIVALLNALEDGYQGMMEPEYLFSAMSHENGGIGYTYVEICISQQRMWCYENGHMIVDTPVVTGNPNRGWGTPSGGVWAIDAMKRDAILEGEGYEEPVDYWMPFNDNIGIHDFQERYHFGGSIYLSNGSHGCVNTPYDAVQQIYSIVSIGTPVIVYE